MFELTDIAKQSPDEVLQTINDTIENIKFRLRQNCDFINDSSHCENKETCDIFKDCNDFSERLIEGKELLNTVHDHPVLNKKIVGIFNKLQEPLQFKIACHGNFRTKTKAEIAFLSQIEIKSAAKNAEFLYNRKGAALHLLGNYEEAIKCFDEVVKSRSKDPNVFFRRGEARYKLELYREARQDFEKSLDLNKQAAAEDKLELENLGTLNLRLGNFESAVADFLKVIELQPDHVGANCRLGEIYAGRQDSLNDMENSVKFLKKAISKDDQHQEARYQLSVAYYNIALYIGGDTSLTHLSSERQEIREKKSCDQASQQAIIVYCQTAIEQIDWLITHFEEIEPLLTQKGKLLRLSRYYAQQGMLLKLVGDNTRQEFKHVDTSRLRDEAIRTLESLKDTPNLKFNVGFIMDGIITFGKFSREEQKQKVVRIMSNFSQLIKNKQAQRVEVRRKIHTAAANFFAGIGSLKTAMQYVSKLEALEERDAVRDSVEYAAKLKKLFDKINLEKQKQKINHQAVSFYMGAIKNFEKALENRQKVDYYYRCTISCLCIVDHVPKLAEMFSEKALALLQSGLKFDPQNKTFTRLLENLQADKKLKVSSDENTDSG